MSSSSLSVLQHDPDQGCLGGDRGGCLLFGCGSCWGRKERRDLSLRDIYEEQGGAPEWCPLRNGGRVTIEGVAGGSPEAA